MSLIRVPLFYLIVFLSLLLVLPDPAKAEQNALAEEFIANLNEGKSEEAYDILLRGAEITRVGAYENTVRYGDFEVLVANTKRMSRIDDYGSVISSKERVAKSRYEKGFAFWYGENTRFGETRLIVEIETSSTKVEAVHYYWIGPVPPPIVVPPRGPSQ